MRADIQQIKRNLRAFEIEEIFKEELGWNHLREKPVVIAYKNQDHAFFPVAEKAGFKIYQHTFLGRIPEARDLKRVSVMFLHSAWDGRSGAVSRGDEPKDGKSRARSQQGPQDEAPARRVGRWQGESEGAREAKRR
jgi:hypothetical protein